MVLLHQPPGRIYLHFDPAVHCLEDLRVVDGMDLDQQGQTLGYYGRKRNESEKTGMVRKRTGGGRGPLRGLRRSAALVFCVRLMAENRKDGMFRTFTAAVTRLQGCVQTHPTGSPPC